MIKHFMVEKPPIRKLVPQWSLALVLRVLREAPFEPMDSISFKALTFKTVFLLALASGRRRSEIHALGVSDGLIKFSKTEAVLRTSPGFWLRIRSRALLLRLFPSRRLAILRAQIHRKWPFVLSGLYPEQKPLGQGG